MTPLDLFGTSAATFSACRTYRYRLWRMWRTPAVPLLAICGLNPSTADECKDDPTIRRCIDFGKQWGFAGLCMVNAFAFRSTSPAGLLPEPDPVGPLNDQTLTEVAALADRFVFAWGRHAILDELLPARAARVTALVRGAAKGELGSFGANGDGSPKHPLYLPKSTPFVREVRR